MEANRFYTLQAIVDEVKNDLEETGTHKDLQFLQWAISGYRDMQFSSPVDVKTCKLKMNGYGAITLPDGCVTYTKVAVKYGRKLVVVGLTGEAGSDLLVSESAVFATPSVYRTKQYTAAYDFQNCDGKTLRGYCYGDLTGAFEVHGNQLQFHPNFHGLPVYLEYITDGIDPCGDTAVHPFLFDYIWAYIHWRRVKADDRNSQALKEEKERDMKKAKLKAAMRLYSREFTPEYVVRLTKVAGNPVIHTL